MKTYQSIKEVIDDLPNLDGYGYFFYNREKWEENPQTAEIMHIAGVEEEDMELIRLDFDDLPPIAYETNMRRFFEVETMRDIVSVQQRNDANSTVDDYIRAINYYAEYDTFLPK